MSCEVAPRDYTYRSHCVNVAAYNSLIVRTDVLCLITQKLYLEICVENISNILYGGDVKVTK